MKQNSKNLSIINRDLIIEGKISSGGYLVIRGKVTGSLSGEKVVIAEEGSVFAEVAVSSLTIGGIFEGEVRASKELIILSTGRCSGAVYCGSLTVESGGLLNATVTHLSSEAIDIQRDKKASFIVTS